MVSYSQGLATDTAAVYRNEEAIGDVLKEHFESGRLTRDAVFITTKLGIKQDPETPSPFFLFKTDHYNTHTCYQHQGPKDHGYNRTLEAMDASLSKLGLAYVDLYLGMSTLRQ
jgi:diketogulonate reductase-like aldo/keto reductase